MEPELIAKLTPEGRNAFLFAYGIAQVSVSQAMETEHLLIGMLHENPGFVNGFLKIKFTGDP